MAGYKKTETIKVPRFEEAAGFYTSPIRSKLMAKIRGKNTAAELLFRKALWSAGVRYRVHCKELPGSPDIVNKRLKLVVFVDGVFWHGHEWQKKKKKIKSNRGFWIPKIERNIQRDQENNARLKEMGFTVFRFWDFEIKKELGICLKKVLDYIENAKKF